MHGREGAASGESGDRKSGGQEGKGGPTASSLPFILLVEVRPLAGDGKGVRKSAVRVWSPSCLTNPERGCL